MKNNENYKIKLKAKYNDEKTKISFETYRANGLEIVAFLAQLNNSIIEKTFPTNKLRGEALIVLLTKLKDTWCK